MSPKHNFLAEIQPGDVLFLVGRSMLSRAIQLRSLSAYSHVGIAMRIPHSYRLWVVEALEGHGVRLVPIDEWLDWGVPLDCYELVALDRDAVVREVLEHVGDEYANWRQFVRSFTWGWRRIARCLGLKIDTDRRRWFCSELVATALSAGGASLEAAPSTLTPGDLSLLPCLHHRGTHFPEKN